MRSRDLRAVELEDPDSEFLDGFDHVFAVVEDQQDMATLEVVHDALGQSHTRLGPGSERFGDGVGDRPTVVEWHEIAEDDAIGKPLGDPVAEIDREMGLADAPGADDRDGRVSIQKIGDLVDLVIASDEAVGLDRQVERRGDPDPAGATIDPTTSCRRGTAD